MEINQRIRNLSRFGFVLVMSLIIIVSGYDVIAGAGGDQAHLKKALTTKIESGVISATDGGITLSSTNAYWTKEKMENARPVPLPHAESLPEIVLESQQPSGNPHRSQLRPRRP